MATKNTWHWENPDLVCGIVQPSGLARSVRFDLKDANLIRNTIIGRLHLMEEVSGRVYCVGRFAPSGATVPVHRWLMGMGRGDRRVVHHKNNDPLDNRRSNLEITTQKHNVRARGAFGKSGRKCVYEDTKRAGKFYVMVTAYGYDTPEEAEVVARAMREARDALLRKVAV